MVARRVGEGRAEEAILLSEEAVRRANAGDALLFRAKAHEETATVYDLLGDPAGAVKALRLALAEYERKGSVVGSQRLRAELDARA